MLLKGPFQRSPLLDMDVVGYLDCLSFLTVMSFDEFYVGFRCLCARLLRALLIMNCQLLCVRPPKQSRWIDLGGVCKFIQTTLFLS